MAEIAGFWSYAHADNEAVDNAIVKLAKRVVAEFELLSGHPLRLFVDRKLEWGDEWKKRIDHELQETTFFIPIITPRYFQSPECRRELIEFRTAAKRFGVRQLLLPIYYVSVPEIEVANPQDELMTLVKTIQREDMREVRLAEEMDSTHRRLVNRLAAKLLKVSRETEGLPTAEEVKGSSAAPSENAGTDGKGLVGPGDGRSSNQQSLSSADESREISDSPEADGELDVLAAGEEALPKWGSAIQALADEVGVVGELVTAATPRLSEADSFVTQLKVANSLAKDLDEPAEHLVDIAQDYSTNLVTVDPAIQQLLDGARSDDDVRDSPVSQDTFRAMLGAVSSSREGAIAIRDLIKNIEIPATKSRELRAPLRKIQTSLRNIVDGQKIMDDWEAQIREIYGDSLDAE